MKKTICFGEVMARLSTPGFLRLRQAIPGELEVTFAGAEVNTAAAVGTLGGPVEFVTALPRNDLTEACLASLRSVGIGVNHVVKREAGRFGLYFVETGANQRGGKVTYDRDGSTFTLTEAEQYLWPEIFRGADWFHTTGISCSLSRVAADTTLTAISAAKAAGMTISFDLNHRRKLWRWDPAHEPAALARLTLEGILPAVDIVMGNAMDMASVADVDCGDALNDLKAVERIARGLAKRFRHLRLIAITLRENHSATHNNWGALLYRPEDDCCFVAPNSSEGYVPYEIRAIVDRVGAGDAFAGALIYALHSADLSAPDKALQFAVAASCLAHSVKGDFNYSTRDEIEHLLNCGGSGWVAR